ncbi:winged helix DNA-binding protein [bacterium]|nr:winged helix DNA-binding protein [bacterium]
MSQRNSKIKHLTERQAQILRFVHAYIHEHGFSPSIREICEAVHLSSSSTVHSHLRSLTEKGYISRDPSKPRAIEVINWEQALAAMPKPSAGKQLGAQVSQLDISRFISQAANSLIYRISSDRYIDQAIMPGDMVIVDPHQTASEGDMVLTQDAKQEPEIRTYSHSQQVSGVVGRIAGVIRDIPHSLKQ